MKVIDYYMSPRSPWTYLGHARLADLAERRRAKVRVKPVDFATIFHLTGGLPLERRAPQRQAYRLVELGRWKDRLGIPLVISPKSFPADAGLASALIAAAPEGRRMSLAGDVLAALWRYDRDIANAEILQEILGRHGLRFTERVSSAAFTQFTREALARGVFGAPTYVYGEELFWGQDRLDFLDEALAS